MANSPDAQSLQNAAEIVRLRKESTELYVKVEILEDQVRALEAKYAKAQKDATMFSQLQPLTDEIADLKTNIQIIDTARTQIHTKLAELTKAAVDKVDVKGGAEANAAAAKATPVAATAGTTATATGNGEGLKALEIVGLKKESTKLYLKVEALEDELRAAKAQYAKAQKDETMFSQLQPLTDQIADLETSIKVTDTARTQITARLAQLAKAAGDKVDVKGGAEANTAAAKATPVGATATGSGEGLAALKDKEKTQQQKVSQLFAPMLAAAKAHGHGSNEHKAAAELYRTAKAELKAIQDQMRPSQNPKAAPVATVTQAKPMATAAKDGTKQRMDVARAAGGAAAGGAAVGAVLAFQAPNVVGAAAAPAQGAAGELAELRRLEVLALGEEKAIVERTQVMLQPVKAVLDQNQGRFPGLQKIELILDRDEQANQDTYPTLALTFKSEKEAAEIYRLFEGVQAEPSNYGGSKTSFKLKPALRTKLTDYRGLNLALVTDENERERIKNAVLVPAGKEAKPGMSAYSLLMALPSLMNLLDIPSVRATKEKLAPKLKKLTSIKPVKETFVAEQWQEQGVGDEIPVWTDEQVEAQLPEVFAIYNMTGPRLMEHIEQNLKLDAVAPRPASKNLINM